MRLVHRARAVELRGINVVDPGVNCRPQDPQRLVPVSRWPEDPVACELHRAVPGPVHPLRAERERTAKVVFLPHETVLDGWLGIRSSP